MNNEYTIVVPNNDVLACVCGTNDSNLKLIEENLGIPVYTKGNEISINNNDSYLCQKFQFIIDRIIHQPKKITLHFHIIHQRFEGCIRASCGAQEMLIGQGYGNIPQATHNGLKPSTTAKTGKHKIRVKTFYNGS